MNLKNNTLVFILLGILLVVLFFVDLLSGSAEISFYDFIRSFRSEADASSSYYIIHNIRFPRAITAIFVGIGLAVSGLLMQTMFRNPLAGPYVLGISSGAGLGVAVYMMSANMVSQWMDIDGAVFTNAGVTISAVVGASLLFMVIMAVSFRIADSVSLLIIGIMFGSLSSAIISVLQYFAEPEQVHRFVIWSMGSLTGTSWEHLKILIPIVIAALGVAFFVIKPADSLLLGDAHAITTGASVQNTKLLIILVTSLASGAVTAFAGPIAFVGMAVPHITRFVFKTSSHKILLPGILFVGAGIMLICDILSQLPAKVFSLPINSVTVLFGAPIVILLIMKNKRLNSSY